VGQYRKKRLSELVGYPRQKDMLMENTSRFLNGLEANNAFLYGSRGTGKTSMIQGLLEEYSDRGLRLVKVYREDIEDLPRISRVLKNRKEKFIINLDDISYDEEEFIYKKHKVSIDSFFDRESQNILLYATSNSQEIVKYFRQETTDSMVLDNRSEEEKKLEPPQKQVYDERRAFTERFGLSIFFGRVDSDTGRQILDFYRKKYHVQENLEELEKEYNRWILYHGSVNGRTIENFFKYYYKK
jgi:predicted AAA+ superfamily ATPase